jgi:hypothetical protein
MTDKPIRVKDFECWNMSVSMLWGRTPKVEMICGYCNHYFTKRFSFYEMRHGNPKVMCPHCYTVNYVPIVVS